MRKHLFALCLIFAAYNLASAIEIQHGPYLQNVTGTEATFVWISDSLSVGWVEIAPDDGLEFYAAERPRWFDAQSGIKNESRVHAVRVTGLQPGTKYRYRVFAREVKEHKGNYVCYGRTDGTPGYGNPGPYSFKTLDTEAQKVTFTMLNDIHGDTEKMRTLLSHTDLDNTDMILFVGDMVSVFENEEQVFSGFMDEAVELFAKQVPMYYTRGNHETRGKSAYTFQNYFSPFSEHIYYMYRQGPVCFIALDSGEDKPDSDIEYYDLTMYDAYRTEQAEWLKKAVQSEEFKTAPFKVVTCHIPPIDSWHGDLEVAEKFIPILSAAGIDIMLCGHLHAHVNSPAGEVASFPILVNSNDSSVNVEADSNTLKIKVVDMSGKVRDTITLKAK